MFHDKASCDVQEVYLGDLDRGHSLRKCHIKKSHRATVRGCGYSLLMCIVSRYTRVPCTHTLLREEKDGFSAHTG